MKDKINALSPVIDYPIVFMEEDDTGDYVEIEDVYNWIVDNVNKYEADDFLNSIE